MVFEDEGANGEAGIHIAAKTEVAYRAAVSAALVGFEFGDNFHSPNFGGAGYGTHRESRPQSVESGQPFGQFALYVRYHVHYMRKALDMHQVFDVDGARSANPAQV